MIITILSDLQKMTALIVQAWTLSVFVPSFRTIWWVIVIIMRYLSWFSQINEVLTPFSLTGYIGSDFVLLLILKYQKDEVIFIFSCINLLKLRRMLHHYWKIWNLTYGPKALYFLKSGSGKNNSLHHLSVFNIYYSSIYLHEMGERHR